MSSEHHPALSTFSWLFGVWESIEAEVSYPTMDSLKYSEVLEFQPTLQPLLEYKSDTWHSVKKTKMHCEKGFLRIDPDSKKVALLLSHNFGLTEISEGTVDKECLNLQSTSFSRMSFSKSAATVKLVRKLELKGEELHSTVLMETVSQPLQLHLKCRYRKKNN